MFEWLTRGFNRESDSGQERGPVMVQGRPLRCNVCANRSFRARQIRLETAMQTLLDLDAWNGIADCAICERCGHIHWFITPTATQDSGTEASGAAEAATGPAV
jgi:hypothetical protein